LTLATEGSGGPAERARWRPGQVDLAFVALTFTALLLDPVLEGHAGAVNPLVCVLALLTSVPILYRRKSPVRVLAAVLPLLLVCLVTFHPNQVAVGIVMLLAFSVGEGGDRTRSLLVGALMAPVVTAAVIITARRGTVSDVVGYTALVLGALVAGDALRARHALQRAQFEASERERSAAAQHRFDLERLRIAHELHDVVGHALVAINVRAASAAHIERHHATASAVPTPLYDIARTSAEALEELRSTLKGLWHAPTEVALLHPVRALEDLPDLVAGVERAGLSIDLDLREHPTTLASSVSHAGYRILQEGLTNVLRHSTASRATIRVSRDRDVLVLEVIDNGRAKADVIGEGQGLRGMRDRAVGLGGICQAGPSNDGGWHVEARIPAPVSS
jgi:signal transduction histidine kinase